MASLVTCKLCKKEHSNDVKRCPHCGAKYSKPLSERPFALAVAATIFGLIVFQCVTTFTKSALTESGLSARTTSTSLPVDTPIALASAATGDTWHYYTELDAITGREYQLAMLVSDNQLSFAFPYKGKNYGQLTVRQHPRYGQDVVFGIDKGQITCGVYDCKLSVRFDSNPPQSFIAAKPEDGSSTSAFIRDRSRFITQAKVAKTILVEFTAYQEGNHVLTFNTAQSLVWPQR